MTMWSMLPATLSPMVAPRQAVGHDLNSGHPTRKSKMSGYLCFCAFEKWVVFACNSVSLSVLTVPIDNNPWKFANYMSLINRHARRQEPIIFLIIPNNLNHILWCILQECGNSYNDCHFISITSLGPSDATWQYSSGSTLACCLTAPCNYLNQCWLPKH